MSTLPPPAAVSLKRVGKRFGDFTAIGELSLDIADNEFFTLLGPSGCGKTTLLRMIAGFEETSAGEIYLYGEEIENLPPDKRPVNTVFQSYALFPHMTVAENIGFGLKMLSWSDDETRDRVADMIAMVKLDAFAQRRPAQLSGGQQQRVALARAMAPRPKVLLLDEPLSALDLKLRQAMRAELKQLQRDTAITFIFVTHDQEEALSMSDRIAVMSAGEVQQIGTPDTIYEAPANRFVADFIGETNLIEATVIQGGDATVTCRVASGDTLHARVDRATPTGATGSLSIRPERLMLLNGDASEGLQDRVSTRDERQLRDAGSVAEGGTSARNNPDSVPPSNLLDGIIGTSVYLGTDRQVSVDIGDGLALSVRVQNTDSRDDLIQTGARVQLAVTDDAARFLCD